eukprot:2073042-Karenia_brevis.AAC.1
MESQPYEGDRPVPPVLEPQPKSRPRSKTPMTPLALALSQQETPEARRARLKQNLARVKERRGY